MSSEDVRIEFAPGEYGRLRPLSNGRYEVTAPCTLGPLTRFRRYLREQGWGYRRAGKREWGWVPPEGRHV